MTSFLAFAKLCQKVEASSGSLEKIDLVAAFLADLDEAELPVACSFVMGTLFSPSLNLVVGVGPSILYEALARACGCPAGQISDMLRATGDPGLVAAGIVEKRRPLGFAAFLGAEALSLTDVYERFVAIARASGRRSQEIKVKNLQFLFSQAGSLEALYIARLAMEDMRIGVGEGGVRDAVARAFAGNGADVEMVERAYNLTNDMGLVAVNARRGTLSQLSVMINHPIKMMLAQLGESIAAALEEIGTAAIEWKYDGARVQIHKDGDSVRVFSRRLENVTASLPEMVQAAKQITAKSAILDGEAVAIGKDGRPMAFQEILKRFRRKYNIEKLAAQIPLRLFLFDLIYLDGRSLTDLPLRERRALLEKIANPNLLADQVLSDSVQKAEEIYRQALDAGHEGLILKNPSSVYAPGKRGKNWLKIKPVMETLDLVVIGAKWGEGRRASFLGSYRLGCQDQATGKLLDVGWVATGFSDEALAELTDMFRELIVVEKGMEVEIKPTVIFEVAYEEIQKSPNYSSGYALRFPRMVAVRDDKSLEEADSLERVISLYRGQRGRSNSA
ncbi:MAG: ATP-dependent DNA ligase [Methanotrichaceae archaeon]|nr:ATP-dependent DNA ligase [Methanotrichaceae archaeon]